jgi:starch synthase
MKICLNVNKHFHDENASNVYAKTMQSAPSFFCKGALETVKKFGWPPDIIHVHGWMSALIPMYIKSYYKKEPVFANSKIIYSATNEVFYSKKWVRPFAKQVLSKHTS